LDLTIRARGRPRKVTTADGATNGDDDCDVDMYDEDIWAQNLGHTLQVLNVVL
jgi:hypothetical protein